MDKFCGVAMRCGKVMALNNYSCEGLITLFDSIFYMILREHVRKCLMIFSLFFLFELYKPSCNSSANSGICRLVFQVLLSFVLFLFFCFVFLCFFCVSTDQSV